MSIDTLPILERETQEESLADLVGRLGDIPLERIRLHPAPGTATEKDVVQTQCCELLDGVLVEKAMGWEESTWAALLIRIIGWYLDHNPIAIIAGADGLTRLAPGRVREPDVAVYLLSRFPGGKAQRRAICDLAPDWAIEILSRSNTPQEMEIKRRHYFEAGVRRVWMVDPRARTVQDWSGPTLMKLLSGKDVAELDQILPGFQLKIGDWFAMVDAVLEPEPDGQGGLQ